MDYTDTTEYVKGYCDGIEDVKKHHPIPNLDFYEASYRLGYFRGREHAWHNIDPKLCEE